MIKWKGYPHEDNTWEPEKNLSCPLLIKRFHERQEESQSQSKSNAEKVAGESSTPKRPKVSPPCASQVLSDGIPGNISQPQGIAKFFKNQSSSQV